MFPITDLRGRVIAFGGRALEKDAQAKYLNSPETPLFHKGGTLYNIAAARAAAHQGAEVIAVEGYVDVIAMVSAGYEATVAPLGTALTAEQLVLLWKMADEPILCFDGDGAGRRAAYRAVDIALPLLKPGKSLQIRDPAGRPGPRRPRALRRAAGGRRAVLGAARPLAQMLWMRETEAGGLDTPERRAALEARLERGDGADRRRDRPQILPAGFRRPPAASVRGRGRAAVPAGSAARRTPSRGSGSPQRPGPGGAASRAAPAGADFGSGTPYVVASQQLAASPVHRGHRAAIPRREALILQALVNHPWLAHDHLEELAGIEFRHADTQKLKRALIDMLAHDGDTDAGGAARGTGRRGLRRAARPGRTRHHHARVWGAGPDAAPEDVLMTWKQLVALHRQWHSLLRELKDAEQALGQDTTEANYSWLQDVKARLSVLDGTEAMIEGFGASSGRTAQTV